MRTAFFGNNAQSRRAALPYVRLGPLRRLLLRLTARSVHYVNGPQTLPPPLKKKEEEEVLARLAAGDELARETLITHNLRLVVYIAKRFENTHVDVEDLVSIGTIGLIKAVNTFCPERNIKLATYASRCIENEILMVLRKNSGGKTEVSIDEPLNVDWDGNELLLSDVLGSDPDAVHRAIEEEDERNCLIRTINTLEDRERLIMYMRFGVGGTKEHTQKEIASLLGISQSYISRLEKRIIRRLRQALSQFTD